MTALDNYLWLEATGQWVEHPEASPREVIVSFRNASLVLSDLRENVLGHWALAGVQKIGEDGDAAIYSMSSDGAETLTIQDAEMNGAIAKVSHGEILAEPHPRSKSKRFSPVGPLTLLLIALILAAISPGILPVLATHMMPPASEPELGDRMLLALMESSGPLCPETPGRLALDSIGEAVQPSPSTLRIRVLDLKKTPVLALPGDTVLVGATTLTGARAPEEIAGWIALAKATDPVAEMMSQAGAIQNLRYIFTGEIDPAPLSRITAADWSIPDTAIIQAAFNSLHARSIDSTPFYDALIRHGWQPDLETPVTVPETAHPETIVSDQEWDAVRAICSG